jgi:hypothetical protein
VDLAFLLTVSRFPDDAQQREPALGHFNRTQNRAAATSNLFWALLNTREFVVTK